MVPDFSALTHQTAPFRMQPGLRRLLPGARHLTPLLPGSAMWEAKHAVLAAGASRLQVTGFDERAVLQAIAARAQAEGLGACEPLELAFEQDFAVLDGTTGTLPWLCVCVPSHWAPEDKLGLPFAAVHAPVADNALLLAASGHLVQLVTGGEAWERGVWTITPDERHDQHPARQVRRPWPDARDGARFAAGCWLRSERQTFFPFGDGTPRAVFTIHVSLQPLADAAAEPGNARRLHDALSTMSDAVLAYKNLTAARAPLLHWLQDREP